MSQQTQLIQCLWVWDVILADGMSQASASNADTHEQTWYLHALPVWIAGNFVFQEATQVSCQASHEGCARSDDIPIKSCQGGDNNGVSCLSQHLSSDLQQTLNIKLAVTGYVQTAAEALQHVCCTGLVGAKEQCSHVMCCVASGCSMFSRSKCSVTWGKLSTLACWIPLSLFSCASALCEHS